MKKRTTIGAALLLLAGCGWHGTGTVVRKDYDRPWTSSSCSTVNKTMICTPLYHPADYTLRIKDAKDGKQHSVSVDESTYSAAKVGAPFTNGQ